MYVTGGFEYGALPSLLLWTCRHYVGNDVVDESLSSETAEPLVFWCTLCI